MPGTNDLGGCDAVLVCQRLDDSYAKVAALTEGAVGLYRDTQCPAIHGKIVLLESRVDFS
jgi:hypothetical protein